MQANIHPITGIAYGVIKANSLDPEILDAISFGSGLDRDYIELQAEFAIKHDAYTLPEGSEDESVYQYWKRVSGELNALDFDWSEFEEESQEFTGNVWLAVYEGVSTLYDTDSSIVMVFESPVIVKVYMCSPCYPNAGDLDSPDMDSPYAKGIQAYGVPEDWMNQY